MMTHAMEAFELAPDDGREGEEQHEDICYENYERKRKIVYSRHKNNTCRTLECAKNALNVHILQFRLVHVTTLQLGQMNFCSSHWLRHFAWKQWPHANSLTGSFRISMSPKQIEQDRSKTWR